MLCATLVAMGSDVCGEPVGFKKVYVYNMKKNLSHIELCVCVVFACVCLLCLRVWTYTGLYIRVCGAQMWAAVWYLPLPHWHWRPSFITKAGTRAWLVGQLRAVINLVQTCPALFRLQLLPDSLPGKFLWHSVSRWVNGQEQWRGESWSSLYSSFIWKLHLKPEPGDACHTLLQLGESPL